MTDDGSASTAGSIETGSTIVLTGSTSGYTASTYKWYESVDNGTTYGNIVGTSSTYTPDNDQPGTIVYKCTIIGSQSEEESGTKSISWYLAETDVVVPGEGSTESTQSSSTTRYYNLQGYDTYTACAFDDVIKVGAYSSTYALAADTVVDFSDAGVTYGTTCFKVLNAGATGDSNTPVISNEYGNHSTACSDCHTALADTSDCTANFNSGSYGAGGTYVLTGFFGTSYGDADDFNISTNIGTVSPTTTTVSALKNGLTVTATAGATLTLTARVGTNCVGTAHTTTVPMSSCNGVLLYGSGNNPASDSNAAAALCGGGRQGTVYLNTTALATATQVYTDSTCTALSSGPRYLSEDASNYYIWTGYVLQGPYIIDCP